MKNRPSTLPESRKFGLTGKVWLNTIGVHPIGDLRTLGSIDTLFLLNEHGPDVSATVVYAVEGARLGMHPNRLRGVGFSADFQKTIETGKKT